MRQTPTLGYLKSRNKLVSMLGKRGLPNPDLMATEHALDRLGSINISPISCLGALSSLRNKVVPVGASNSTPPSTRVGFTTLLLVLIFPNI